jgi:glutaredoxin
MTKVYRFTATWCQPCKNLAKTLEADGFNIPAIDINSPGVEHLLIDFNIRSVPTLVIDYGNNQFIKFTGDKLTEAIKQQLREALN